MQSSVQFIVNGSLDPVTVAEIEEMRRLRLNHYRNVLRIPEKALEILRVAGLTGAESVDELTKITQSTISEIESRLKEPHVIYDDEITLYVESLSSSEV